MYVCICIYIYIYTHSCFPQAMYVCMYVCTDVCVYVCMYVCMYVSYSMCRLVYVVQFSICRRVSLLRVLAYNIIQCSVAQYSIVQCSVVSIVLSQYSIVLSTGIQCSSQFRRGCRKEVWIVCPIFYIEFVLSSMVCLAPTSSAIHHV